MAAFSSPSIEYEHDKKEKEKVRKRGNSAKDKTVKLGREARVFSATVHYNPTYRQLDGAIYVPEGQSIPDVNKFLLDLYHGRQPIERRRRSRLTRSTARHLPRESTPTLDEITVEMSDSESQGPASGAVHGGGAGEDPHRDPQPAAGDHHDTNHLEGESGTGGFSGSVDDTTYNLTESIGDVNDAEVDAVGSPEIAAVTLATPEVTGKDVVDEYTGCQTDGDTSVGDTLIAQEACDAEIGCQTGTDFDFDWSGLELPEFTENRPAISDWPVVGVEKTLHSGQPSEDVKRTTARSMQTRSMAQRQLFESVSTQLWRAEQNRRAAERAATGGLSHGNGIRGRSRGILKDGRKQRSQPDTGRQGSTRLMASPTTVKSPTTAMSEVGAPMQQQARFFYALALRFRHHTQAEAARS
ncbi:hypothetical protein CSUB01_10566 [Colletotrichum sublineola]|uniref:Uncharacterized protein n=1 Tax=Colletotrichum sublineola TaxID=1173701 RepID=A0A066XGA1_COLSU|nr:hypothetical protein CSUB01_10566 [Colletotrichum sublineola]